MKRTRKLMVILIVILALSIVIVPFNLMPVYRIVSGTSITDAEADRIINRAEVAGKVTTSVTVLSGVCLIALYLYERKTKSK